MTKSKIPEGWGDYTPVGKRIDKTRFVCFKVPLKESLLINQQVPEEERFSPDDVLRILKERGDELGLIIDLTNTARYYDPMFFKDQEIEYEKIFTGGRVVPPKEISEKFSEIVRNFTEKNSDNDKLIGVHCTHGLNRSGYMVCKHLIDHMDFTAEEALAAFNSARGHDVERENYINALHGRPYVDPPTSPDRFSRFRQDAHNRRGRGRAWRSRSPVDRRDHDGPFRRGDPQSCHQRDTYNRFHDNSDFGRHGNGRNDYGCYENEYGYYGPSDGYYGDRRGFRNGYYENIDDRCHGYYGDPYARDWSGDWRSHGNGYRGYVDPGRRFHDDCTLQEAGWSSSRPIIISDSRRFDNRHNRDNRYNQQWREARKDTDRDRRSRSRSQHEH